MTEAELIAKLCADIKEHNSKIPLLVNISGCFGAGKSHWAEPIAAGFKELGVSTTHISEDDFLHPREYRESLREKIYESGPWKDKTYWDNHENWLRLDLMKEVILNLRKGRPTTYYPYKRELGAFSDKEKTAESADIVIFETSIFNELFDIVILVDVDDPLKRKLERDSDLRNEEKIREYHKVQLEFWNKYKPTNPDYIIDNNDFENPKLHTNPKV